MGGGAGPPRRGHGGRAELDQSFGEGFAILGGSLIAENLNNWGDAIAYCNARSLAEGLTPAYSVGAGFDVSWDRAADGWRLRVQAPGALSLNLGFERFRLPKGGRLVVHPAGDNALAREFTRIDQRDHGQLWTPVVLTDELVIETGSRRRSLPLPRRVARLELAKARVQGNSLVVHFTAAYRYVVPLAA